MRDIEETSGIPNGTVLSHDTSTILYRHLITREGDEPTPETLMLLEECRPLQIIAHQPPPLIDRSPTQIPGDRVPWIGMHSCERHRKRYRAQGMWASRPLCPAQGENRSAGR